MIVYIVLLVDHLGTSNLRLEDMYNHDEYLVLLIGTQQSFDVRYLWRIFVRVSHL